MSSALPRSLSASTVSSSSSSAAAAATAFAAAAFAAAAAASVRIRLQLQLDVHLVVQLSHEQTERFRRVATDRAAARGDDKAQKHALDPTAAHGRLEPRGEQRRKAADGVSGST